MRQRQSFWVSLGEVRRGGGDSGAFVYEFGSREVSDSRCGFSGSDDGWLRVELAAEEVWGRREARSWALDREAEGRRRWGSVDVEGPVSFSENRTYRYAAGHEGVEGSANPHEDTRGVVPVVVAGERFVLPVTGRTSGDAGGATGCGAMVGEMEISRCADGFLISVPLGRGNRVYGLGEKTGGLDKRGRSWVMWNTDDPLHTAGKDPLYQSIPVVYVVGGGGVATVFVDSTATIWFDVGEADEGRLQIEVYDPAVSIYIRHDGSLPEAVRGYTGLTGRMSLPPEWALGFQQCRYSYFPESRVMEVARKMRELKVPCDVIYLDIHYMDGYRVFTWDPVRFPDPKGMIDELHGLGFKVVTIVDPGVKYDPGYPVFADGLQKGVFLEGIENRVDSGAVKRSNAETSPEKVVSDLVNAGDTMSSGGSTNRLADTSSSARANSGGGPYVGTVWPGKAVFPDFTETRVQEWWAGHHEALFGVGVDGIWNDMNEPADFDGAGCGDRKDGAKGVAGEAVGGGQPEVGQPDGGGVGGVPYPPCFTVPGRLVAGNDGSPAPMDRMHNAYGSGMNEATRKAMDRFLPERRGFVLTRSGYAGVQRNAAVWTGDNHSWWEHIRLAVPMVANLGLSGVAFSGGDVGGFQMNADGELYARWVAAVCLMPFFRAHSALDTVDHEPWSFGQEVLEIARRFIGLRYRLMPYLYSLFEEATRTGAPVVRPLVWEFPDDPQVARRADSFLVGPAVLVAPVSDPAYA
ncbi:MAG: TIM-barrel domain-containing protein, partial [Alkalispirochaeta sp.]